MPDLDAPLNSIHYRLFYPATYGGTDNERLTGQLPADPALAPWPIAIVMPGINVGPEGYRWLAIRLAESGIAALTYALLTEVMPDMVGISPGLDLGAVSVGEYGTRPSATAIAPLISALHDENASGPLAGLLAPDMIALIGHSAGGTVALENADPQWFFGVRAVISYGSHTMPALPLGHPPGTVLAVPADVPALIMAGDCDGVIQASIDRYGGDLTLHNPVRRTFNEGLTGRRGDSYRVVIGGGTHLSMLDPIDMTSARGFLDPIGEEAESVRACIGDLCVAFCRQTMADAPQSVMSAALSNDLVEEWECR